LDENESQAIEGAAAVGFIRLMAVGLAVVDAEDTSRTGERKGDGIIGSGNDTALRVLHGDGNMGYVIWRRAKALPTFIPFAVRVPGVYVTSHVR
jgi:hypothetical protein